MWRRNSEHQDKPVDSLNLEATYIGKSIVIKGDLSGSGDVHVAGEVEGSIELTDGGLTVGPEGRVHGDVAAGSIVIHGRVDGNLFASKSIDLKASAVLVGEIYTSCIVIEEGASLMGSVEVEKDIPALELKRQRSSKGTAKKRGRGEVSEQK